MSTALEIVGAILIVVGVVVAVGVTVGWVFAGGAGLVVVGAILVFAAYALDEGQ